MQNQSTVSPSAIAYIRVSSEEQGRGYSLVTQEQSVRAYCAERGYDLLSVFTDTHTGTELDRPGLNAAFDAVAASKPAVVVIHDVDRLGREFVVQAIAERELTRHGAKIAYVLGGSTDTGDGILLKGVKQALAAYENYQRVERSRRGKQGRVQAGHVLVFGRPPYGYRDVGGKREGRLEPHPAEAEIVRQMYRWLVDERLSCCAIAKRLTADGIPTRADTSSLVHKENARCVWRPDTVAKIIRSEANKGRWHYGKTKKVRDDAAGTRRRTKPQDSAGPGMVQRAQPREAWRAVAVPALVDDATWEAAQAQLRVNQARSKGNGKRDYLLRGRITCPDCGRRWGGSFRNGHGYYHCARTASLPWRQTCGTRYSIRQDRLEGAVLDALRAFLLDPDVRATGVAAEQERVSAQRQRATDDLATADRAVAGVTAKLGKLLDEALTDGFPADVVETRKRDLLAERERRLRQREAALAALNDAAAPDLDAAIAALAPLVEQAFAAATPDDLSRLLDLLRVEVAVIDRDAARISGVLGGAHGHIVMLSCVRNRHTRTSGSPPGNSRGQRRLRPCS